MSWDGAAALLLVLDAVLFLGYRIRRILRRRQEAARLTEEKYV